MFLNNNDNNTWKWGKDSSDKLHWFLLSPEHNAKHENYMKPSTADSLPEANFCVTSVTVGADLSK